MKKFHFLWKVFIVILSFFVYLPVTSGMELSLEQAVQLALSNNTDLYITQNEEESAEAELRRARGEEGVSLSLSSNLAANKPIGEDQTESLSNSLTATIPLYTGGKNQANVESGKIGVKSAELRTERQREDLKLNVIQAYTHALQDKKTVDVRQEAVDNYEAHHYITNQRYLAGDVARVDVIRASVELSNAQYELIQAQNNYETRLDTLRNYLNIDSNEPLNLAEAFQYEQFSIPLDDCVDYAHNKRKDLLVDLYSLKQKELAIKTAKSGYLPTVNASIGTGFNGNSASSWEMKKDVSATVSVSWNIFDSGVTAAQVDAAKKDRDVARLTYEKDKSNADLTLREAYHNMRGAEKQLQSTRDAVAKAKEDYYISGEKYKAGEGIMLDVLDAQKSLSDAELNHISAQYDYLRYKAAVENAMGIGLKDNEHVAAKDLSEYFLAPMNIDEAIESMEQSIASSNPIENTMKSDTVEQPHMRNVEPLNGGKERATENSELSAATKNTLPASGDSPKLNIPEDDPPPLISLENAQDDTLSLPTEDASQVLDELARNQVYAVSVTPNFRVEPMRLSYSSHRTTTPQANTLSIKAGKTKNVNHVINMESDISTKPVEKTSSVSNDAFYESEQMYSDTYANIMSMASTGSVNHDGTHQAYNSKELEVSFPYLEFHSKVREIQNIPSKMQEKYFVADEKPSLDRTFVPEQGKLPMVTSLSDTERNELADNLSIISEKKEVSISADIERTDSTASEIRGKSMSSTNRAGDLPLAFTISPSHSHPADVESYIETSIIRDDATIDFPRMEASSMPISSASSSLPNGFTPHEHPKHEVLSLAVGKTDVETKNKSETSESNTTKDSNEHSVISDGTMEKLDTSNEGRLHAILLVLAVGGFGLYYYLGMKK